MTQVELAFKPRNPDVLTCIANLSNDAVFTPPELANQMLDTLEGAWAESNKGQSIWENSELTFIDPFTKSGVFLREIVKRLVKGLETEIPDLQERVDHILTKQVFGIATETLTGLLARRSVYCSKYANGKHSIAKSFSDKDGNIWFERTEHTWVGGNEIVITADEEGNPIEKKKNGRCKYCGASQKEYERDASLESHAYAFIHTDDIKQRVNEIFGGEMKFDVIVGNPPYQLSDGGNQASATPIYQKFVEQAKKLEPRFLTMVVPARWYNGGRGLDEFRNEMLQENKLRVIHDFPMSSDCFPGVEIKGGVCYFLWNVEETGLCEIYEHRDGIVECNKRPLLDEGMATFIRYEKAISILRKVRSKAERPLTEILNGGRFFGFHTRVSWEDSKVGTLQTADGKDTFPIRSERSKEFPVKVFISYGECWIQEKSVTKNKKHIDSYKVLIPRSGNPGSTILGKPKISGPGSCSSNTYVVAIIPSGLNESNFASNLVSYISTKFLRFLVSLKSSTQDFPPKAYDFVPMQDFSKPWSDEELYEKYGLDQDEIDFIERIIKPMEVESE